MTTSGLRSLLHGLLPPASLVLLAAAVVAPPAHAQAIAAADAPPVSRFDFYAGYAYYRPFSSDINNFKFETLPVGAVGNAALYFRPHLGLQVEGSAFPSGPQDNACLYSAEAGPIYRRQYGRLVPFVHALGGAVQVGGPLLQPCSVWGWGVTGGGGVDFVLPVFHNRLALRLAQADFMYSHVDNGPLLKPGNQGGLGESYAVRASAGIVLRFGDMQANAVKGKPSLICSAAPAEAYPGDPVTVTASTLNLPESTRYKYAWSASGGKLAASDSATEAIDTRGLEPGTYTVSGKLMKDANGRLIADCTTTFAIRTYAPPTVTCSADPAAINSGNPVTITAVGHSTDNRPLTYSYATNAGAVVGSASGGTAGLTTVGVAPGTITVTCSVIDDKGHTGSATTSVVVATPPPPVAAPQARALCGLTFDRDRKRPDRVDNEAKGCLDEIALTLNRETGDRLLMIGNHAAGETTRDAAERAMNAAQYLTKEKGIDPTRIDLRVGSDGFRSVVNMLVPPGAQVHASAAQSFDTSTVQHRGQAYGVPGATRSQSRTRTRHATRRIRRHTTRAATHTARTVTHRKTTRRRSHRAAAAAPPTVP